MKKNNLHSKIVQRYTNKEKEKTIIENLFEQLYDSKKSRIAFDKNKLSRHNKTKQSLFYMLKSGSKARMFIASIQNQEIVDEIIKAAPIAYAHSRINIKNMYLVDCLIHNRTLEYQSMLQEFNRISTFVSTLSDIEKRCFKDYIQSGFHDMKEQKYLCSLFISHLKLIKKNKDGHLIKKLKNNGVSIDSLIQYYYNNKKDVRLRKLILPIFITNDNAIEIIEKEYKTAQYKIRNIGKHYGRIKHGKFFFVRNANTGNK